MEITLSKSLGELVLVYGKDCVLSEYGIHIDGNKFSLRLMGFRVNGTFSRQISEKEIRLKFYNKLSGAEIKIEMARTFEGILVKNNISVRSWGLLGFVLKNKLNQTLTNLLIDIEFKRGQLVRYETISNVKFFTNWSGLLEMMEKLSTSTSRCFVFVINKEHVVEISNGIILSSEEVKDYCRDLCEVMMFELEPIA